ncbi:hypothetical protein FKW81_17850 [Rhodobacter capsulatus]|jgi:hypothetical protein|nr:hypothetical protein A499_24674 [Niallia nealsonii AAU1]TQD31986.1 hypothetical protein FKW81_17850 [Rhodobacter capsulatus]
MDFYWVGLLFWCLILISIFCFIFGVLKNSLKLLTLSILSILPISYYFFGAENIFKILVFLPLIPLSVLLYYSMKKADS